MHLSGQEPPIPVPTWDFKYCPLFIETLGYISPYDGDWREFIRNILLKVSKEKSAFLFPPVNVQYVACVEVFHPEALV